MKIARKISEVRQFLARNGGKSLGFVPTMGDLHEGHLSLVRRSKKENDLTAVSIFVNPSQFNQKKDFQIYHRDEKRDLSLLKKHNVDLVFMPEPSEIYPKGFQTWVQVDDLTLGLCGPHRPGHFKGVATVVAMLFNIVQPSKAYLGMKDFQQLKVIERLVHDLHMPITIVPCPTAREADGLAMSSRNRRLSPSEHIRAVQFARALRDAGENSKAGKMSVPKIYRRFLEDASLNKKDVDYLEIADPETLLPLKKIKKPFVIAAAVWIGKTRLIDNHLYA